MIKAYTDGSASKNRSGWGYVLVFPDGTITPVCGVWNGATNQQMELLAAIEALDYWRNNLKDKYDITVYSDSAYLTNCYNEQWYINWEANGWYNSKNQPVANQEYWEKLIPYFKMPQVHIEKVKGHSGHVYNDMADALACGIYDKKNLTNKKINDTINIKLSEILTEFKMSKRTINDTIEKIMEVFNG